MPEWLMGRVFFAPPLDCLAKRQQLTCKLVRHIVNYNPKARHLNASIYTQFNPLTLLIEL